MTANQIYKLSGSKTPFSEWIGEQKTKYGEKFIENEKFINMSGANFVGDDIQRNPDQVIMENADENIEYPKGGGVSGELEIGGTEISASAGVSNFPTRNLIMLVGGIVVAVWLYKRYVK